MVYKLCNYLSSNIFSAEDAENLIFQSTISLKFDKKKHGGDLIFSWALSSVGRAADS